jgi:hypothetical protein
VTGVGVPQPDPDLLHQLVHLSTTELVFLAYPPDHAREALEHALEGG